MSDNGCYGADQGRVINPFPEDKNTLPARGEYALTTGERGSLVWVGHANVALSNGEVHALAAALWLVDGEERLYVYGRVSYPRVGIETKRFVVRREDGRVDGYHTPQGYMEGWPTALGQR